jgi:hypothetical protein
MAADEQSAGAGDVDGDNGADETTQSGGKRRTRRPRSFPPMSFNEALFLAQAIHTHGSGQKVRRITLFEALNRSPTSGATRNMITASGQYGLTTGGYNAEFLELTPIGRTASDPSLPESQRLPAQIQLAVMDVEPFKNVFDQYQGLRLPTVEVLRDAFKNAGVPDEYVKEAVETFLANAREVGLVRTIAGAEHLVSADAVVERVAEEEAATTPPPGGAGAPAAESTTAPETPRVAPIVATPRWGSVQEDDLSKTCFIVSPIGADNSEQRQHADLVLGSLIEPALQDLGLTPVRADQISKPGLITGQVIEHIAKAALVIADLSFANPNVYYELALRHAARRPVVQITRSSDKLPFDVGQYRTVTIDMTSIYSLVPQLELHKQEITRQCRAALNEGVPSQTQLSLFFPQFWDHIAK